MSLRSAAPSLQATNIRHNCLPLTEKPYFTQRRHVLHDPVAAKLKHAQEGVLVRSVSPGTPATGDSAGDNGPNGSSSSSSSGAPGLFQRWQQDSRRMQEKLKALGAAGVIAYGEPVAADGRNRLMVPACTTCYTECAVWPCSSGRFPQSIATAML